MNKNFKLKFQNISLEWEVYHKNQFKAS